MYLRLPVLFALCVAAGSAASAQEPPAAYRVVRAAPDALVSAMRAPVPKQETGAAANSSRLQRYFRIKTKTVDGPRIHLELFPNVPLLEKYFPRTSTVRISLREVKRAGNTFEFDSRVEALDGNWLKTTLHIEPSPAGALLKLQMNDGSYGPTARKLFMHAALKLGFLFATAEEAEMNTPVASSEKSQRKPAK